MPLRDDGFSKDRRGHGDPRFLDELQQIILHAEAVHLDVGQDHGLAGFVEHGGRFRQGFLEDERITRLVQIANTVIRAAHGTVTRSRGSSR